MKVIFLGFDGVLNDYDFRETVVDYHENLIDERSVLKAIEISN